MDAQAVILNNRIYVMGYSGYAELDATINISNDLNAVWEQLNSPASFSALTVFDSQLVMVGGRSCTSCEVTGELWSLEDEGKGKWTQPLPAMPTARLAASAVTIKNYLIVAGGCGSDGQYLDVVEVYHTTTHWTRIDCLPSPCVHMKTVHHDTIFYLIGGMRQGNSIFYSSLQTVIDRLSSPTTTIWNTLPEAPYEGSSITICKDTLVAIGGDSFSSPTASLHIYSPYTNEWERMETELPEAVSHTCSITLPVGEIVVIGGVRRRTFMVAACKV